MEAGKAKLVPSVALSLLLCPGHLWPGPGGSRSWGVPPLLVPGGRLGMGVGCVSGGAPGWGGLMTLKRKAAEHRPVECPPEGSDLCGEWGVS